MKEGILGGVRYGFSLNLLPARVSLSTRTDPVRRFKCDGSRCSPRSSIRAAVHARRRDIRRVCSNGASRWETRSLRHALVGSCARSQRVHLSAGAQIGGVLEPSQLPVVSKMMSGRRKSGIYEGTSSLAASRPGVVLTGRLRVQHRPRAGVPERRRTGPGYRSAHSSFRAAKMKVNRAGHELQIAHTMIVSNATRKRIRRQRRRSPALKPASRLADIECLDPQINRWRLRLRESRSNEPNLEPMNSARAARGVIHAVAYSPIPVLSSDAPRCQPKGSKAEICVTAGTQEASSRFQAYVERGYEVLFEPARCVRDSSRIWGDGCHLRSRRRLALRPPPPPEARSFANEAPRREHALNPLGSIASETHSVLSRNWPMPKGVSS